MILKYIAAAVFFYVLCSGISYSSTAQANSTIRFHHDMAINSALHEGAIAFQREMAKLSDNKMTVELYPANSLGDDQYATELLQIGIIQVAVVPTSKLANFSPSLKTLDYPYLFGNKESAYRVLDGPIGAEMLDDMRSKGIEGVGFWESGFKQITCNNVFSQEKPEEDEILKGIPVRIMASDVLNKQYQAAKALPLVIPFSEIYVALQHGLAKCQENPIVSIAKMRIYEVQNELLLSNHGYLGYAFIVSSRWFDSLNDEEKRILRAAEQTARNEQRRISSELEQSYLQEILSSGSTKLVSSNFITPLKRKFLQVEADPETQKMIVRIRGNEK
ncbi:TRAP transporter substrate-binding protein [Photobacterium sp.]|uniref:TRAP transporter substrate-binding protein n=1 Tax=Photobacterium sp. TaxID=660 RepID=UPI00299EE6E6|nr:TRAP transporter substrate-binding protein [Photobacterium sp.]MDX1301451.1 TRAP transporter substrate-binding protein [Photobacterium sp.]